MLNQLHTASPPSAGFMSRLPPAVLAVLVQCTALLVVCLSAPIVSLLEPVSYVFGIFVLLQALLASIFSQVTKMAPWWRWIHFVFPLALYGLSIWQIPSQIYLLGFLFTLGLFWTTFRTQVPFYPSNRLVWEKVVSLIPPQTPLRVIDIGSGLGDMAMHVAKAHPDCLVEGVEIAPLPWLISKIRALLKGSGACFSRQDYRKLNFAEYDVVLAYLSPAAMPQLWEKVQREMRSGGLLMSYEFVIPGVVPTQVIAAGHNEQLYVWKM